MRPPSFLALALLFASGFAAAQQTYEIDARMSEIHWLVFRTGPLARLGHNHAISVAGLSGRVVVDAKALAQSRFELEIPVAALLVDDPKLRITLGEPFAGVPTAKEIEGTRRNMLGARVLHADRYPVLRLTGTGPTGDGGRQILQVKIELLGRTVERALPVRVAISGDDLEATGAFELSHAELGMRPFRVMLGALRVAEKMTYSYRIRARRVADHSAP